MKDIAIKKQNPIKRITQTQPTPITTSNKFEKLKEMEIEKKTPSSKTQTKKIQKIYKLNEHQKSKSQ